MLLLETPFWVLIFLNKSYCLGFTLAEIMMLLLAEILRTMLIEGFPVV